MLAVRSSEQLYHARGRTKRGSFAGLWHFSFDRYHDPEWVSFGTLRVHNDDIISPGGEWGIHPHRRNEVLTYVMKGEFVHEDEHGVGGTMTKGTMQHTTVGTGMWHNEINGRDDEEMRFIQMWFFPDEEGLPPSYSQASPAKEDRLNKLLLLASKGQDAPLSIHSDVNAYVSHSSISVEAQGDVELLLLEVSLTAPYISRYV